MSGITEPNRYFYEQVAASQTNQIIGTTGGAGDYLHRLVCTVATAATSQVQIKDGSGTAYTILPNAVGGGIGVYNIEINAASQVGAWQVTTAAGVTVLAIGKFA